ncbi:hypothetical protein IV102_30135 [bacterium]|nr:hypothetical protein [bacterium]
MSLAELCRRSLEQYLVQWPHSMEQKEWQLPVLSLGPFIAPCSEWRTLANEPEQA